MSDDDRGGAPHIDLVEVLASAPHAFIVMDADGIVRWWNLAAEAMFGWPASEAVGGRLSEMIIPERYRPLHEQGLRTYLETGVGPVLGTTIEIEGQHRDGHLVPVELSITPSRDRSGGVAFHAFLTDITQRRRLERCLRARARAGWMVTRAGQAATTSQLLEAIGQEMGFVLGLAWSPRQPGGDALVVTASWASTDMARSFVSSSSEMAFERGVGMPGTAWVDAVPLWSARVSQDPRYLRAAAAAALGLESALLVPVGDAGGVRHVLEFLTEEPMPAGPDLLEQMAQLGADLAGVLD